VPGTDPTSWNKERPDGITFTFQVRTTRFEFHIDDSSNILSKHPIGPELPHDSKHFRPEVTVVLLASTLPGTTERLAGESPEMRVGLSMPVRRLKSSADKSRMSVH